MKKVIKMTLSTESINSAIRQVNEYREEIKQKCGELVKLLTDEGVKIAKVQVAAMGAIYTGELEGSIEGIYNPGSQIGMIRAGAWYAVFVEYGTGVVGAAAPHPDPSGWTYDSNQHGEDGWWYLNDRDGKWHWTKGHASRPFMYNTARELKQICAEKAREVFK